MNSDKFKQLSEQGYLTVEPSEMWLPAHSKDGLWKNYFIGQHGHLLHLSRGWMINTETNELVEMKIDQLDHSSAPLMAYMLDAAASEPEGGIQTKQLTEPEKIEQVILQICITDIDARSSISELDLDETSGLFRPLFEILQNHPTAETKDLVTMLPDYADTIRGLDAEGNKLFSKLSKYDVGLEAYTQVGKLHKLNIEMSKRRIAKQIQEAEATGDRVKVKQLLSDYQRLMDKEQ